MIIEKNGNFWLNTKNTSYWLRVTEFKHIESVHYGERLAEGDMQPLAVKRTSSVGSSVMYSETSDTYCLDTIALEWSGIGKGDYREPPCEIIMPDKTYNCDFLYAGHEIVAGGVELGGLPTAEAADQTLIIHTKEANCGIFLDLYYSLYYETDVISRSVRLINGSESGIEIRRIMSFMLDLPNREYKMVTFNGGWIKEANRHERSISYGSVVNESRTGASSNRTNPGFLIAQSFAREDYGRVYGFNLIYSGNHYSSAELSPHDLLRISCGINPCCFSWSLAPGQDFCTPQAVMSFSGEGYNGLSDNFHRFVNEHIVRGEWKNRERPVLVNDWESYFFKFTTGKLLRLARLGRKLGAELFVLDDGWFKGRDNDRAGLGDYQINSKKLPGGIKRLAERITKMGLAFGLWFEPESVNADSDLYRAHPDYAIRPFSGKAALGRNQMLLDLTRPEVRDYIVSSVGAVLDSAPITYVKWDMNRHISDACSGSLDNQGEFYHRYTLGLYDILQRIFRPRPQILLESCSSGGNRFDLGMLCYSPQIWASDDTDPAERLKIQGGLSYLYPQSTMGAHVSSSPHQQTLRSTKLSERFNVAAFGCLGYEMELKYLTPAERKQVKYDIEWYKAHRRLLQFGRLVRVESGKPNKRIVEVVSRSGDRAVCGFYQTQSTASEGGDIMPVKFLDKKMRFRVDTKPQGLEIRGFGALVHHILPVRLAPDGFILRIANRHYQLPDCEEHYEAGGDLLNDGIRLHNQFVGSYYNKDIRLLGENGSSLYNIEGSETDSYKIK